MRLGICLFFFNPVFKGNNSSKRHNIWNVDPDFHSESRHTTHKEQDMISVQPNVTFQFSLNSWEKKK